MKIKLIFVILLLINYAQLVFAEDSPPKDSPLKVGVATILSGDLAVGGDNTRKSIETYQKLYPNPRLNFIYEDCRLSSSEGLRAFQSLINSHGVDLIIGGCTSNGLMASAALINRSKVPVISISTGGSNVDDAGKYIFRIGNSDSLNGIEQAVHFEANGLKQIAVLTEQTEYTQDISRFFFPKFQELGGEVVFSEEFLPGTSDFRSLAVRIRESKPQAIFMPTQTGTALGVFLRQWNEVAPDSKAEVHTTFVAAPNHDAHAVAGQYIVGVYYMEPAYSEKNERRIEFFESFKAMHGADPSIPFHTAGVVDTLDLLSIYLEKNPVFDEAGFREFLHSVEDYDGMLGTLNFDDRGNTAIGFRLNRIEKNILD